MPSDPGPRSHADDVAALVAEYQRIPRGARVRLAKPTSNLFRFREQAVSGLDVGRFNRVLRVDPQEGIAEVQGMATYETLVDGLLPHGLMPLVVPQLKTITLGGAIAGLGIESTSFRSGLPHESVREMEILTGDGEVVVARPEGEHAELFRGFPNSYGTLGYTLRLVIEVERVSPYVHLRHVRFGSARECAQAIAEVCRTREFEGRSVDFVDGAVFSATEMYLTLGSYARESPTAPSDYTGQNIYYRSIQQRQADNLRIGDYLWRWDTDWFWCSAALGAQHPLIRPLWPRRYRRSDVYRRIVAWERRNRVFDRIQRARGRVEEPVIQDVEIPVDRLAEFLDFFHRDIKISPVWLCPIQLRDPKGWPLYPMDPDTLYVNVGFWASAPLGPGQEMGSHNKAIERKVTEVDGHKSLYSESYYDEDEFWRLYNKPAYERLKQRYDPEQRLPGLYDKCVRAI